MTFTSLPYFLFLPILLILFAGTPQRFRWLLLLAASYYFYACLNVPYLLMTLAVVTGITYGCGILIHRATADATRRIWLSGGIVTNLSVLIWLKYLPFLADNANLLLNGPFPSLRITISHHFIAIGVSYFVFQGISYLIDIYLDILEPERHPGYFALAMSFFPKLLQGPIERGGNILPQLRALTPLNWENLRAGANLFLWGMFKKVVIADRLAAFVDPVYNNVHAYHGLSLVIATYLFALQIYFDFSGYTDMALGTARCFNIRLTQNFNSPYLATSIADFWRRWHISFSNWILDYIFKPVQMQLRDWQRWGTPLALMVTFLASGIWHGASWNFIAWGAIHGFYLSVAVLFRQQKRKLHKALGIEKSRILAVWQVVITFNMVSFSWIFFRAATFHDALHVAWNGVAGLPRSFALMATGNGAWANHLMLGAPPGEFLGVMALVLLVPCAVALDRCMAASRPAAGELQWLARLPFWGKGIVYGLFCYLIAFCGAASQSFMYLQF